MTLTLTLGASEQISVFCVIQDIVVTFLLSWHGTVENVQVASGATAWTDQDTGITHIFVVHQGLWFGTKMPHSLMNPNQTRVHGFYVCYDPFDPNRSLGIVDTDSGMLIPLKMSGSTVPRISCTNRARTQ